ncbi:uncharacterized protein LAESUDRAFT_730346 [Laetiporus sulphureus 93-53]|uniref:F-box domain-containing protein n=1 Tax=Laetiporus sulphureus 93-53 TaxID=1314785 RepID=A0A165C849_9APHY|nr:uncharacterized protein LAESUDRAFT_730346 [Laetiporus sulphureus 93-53]KZT02367.1 hypothetical protein LAESUDRAFT_730346 [Laetiporus sulphureus 93-53]
MASRRVVHDDLPFEPMDLQVIGNHPEHVDESMLSISISTKDRLDLGDVEAAAPKATLGALSPLPTELFDFVVQDSDLRTVAALRLVNRRARTSVDASAPYKYLLRHAPHIVAALAQTGISSFFTVDQVFQVLCSNRCVQCDKFGSVLFIPECLRCCFSCLQNVSWMMPMTESDAKAVYGLTRRALVDVPSMLSLPGTYTFESLAHRKRFRLYSYRMVELHGDADVVLRYLNKEGLSARNQSWRRLWEPARNGSKFITSARFMAGISIPWFDTVTRTTYAGYACRGCQLRVMRRLKQGIDVALVPELMCRQYRMYLEDELLEHAKHCPEAQEISALANLSRKLSTQGSPVTEEQSQLLEQMALDLIV